MVKKKKKRVLALLGNLEFYLPEQTENKEVVILEGDECFGKKAGKWDSECRVGSCNFQLVVIKCFIRVKTRRR